MDYTAIWQRTLNENEPILYEFSVGQGYLRLGFLAWCFVGALLIPLFGLGFLVIAVGLFYFYYYLPVANAYAFTDRRIVIRTGWLSTALTSVDYDKITDLSVSEPLFDRLVSRTGHVLIDTAGTDYKEVMLLHVQDPYDVRKRLDTLRDAYIHGIPATPQPVTPLFPPE